MVTCTHGNGKNKIRGSRITVKNEKGEIVDCFVVPSHYGIKYCQKYRNGEYGKRYFSAIEKAKGEKK